MDPRDDDREQQEIKRLLARVLHLPPDDRVEAVKTDPTANGRVKAEVLDLVTADCNAGPMINGFITKTFQDRHSAPTSIGPYRIERLLGRGGSATVYLATRADTFDKPFAIKVLDYSGVHERFQRELRALAKLDHPNIVRLYDGGVTDDGKSYIVMEYVEGDHIDVYCRKRQLSIEGRLRLFQSVCEGVAYANLQLVVHRDLKPSNILVTAKGVPKLLDFGIAKLLDGDGGPDRTTRSMTLRYSSPEHVQGGEVTVASDVYSLGVALFELLTGRSPYTSTDLDLAGLTDEIVHRDPELPRESGREISPELRAIVLRALRKRPEDRYRSVDALSADIARHLSGWPVEALRGTVAYRARKFTKRNRVGLLVASITAALSVTCGIIAFRYAVAAQASLVRATEISADAVHQIGVSASNHDRAGWLELAKTTQAHLTQLAAENPRNDGLRRLLVGLLFEIAESQGHPDAHNLGDPKSARFTFEQATAIAEELYRKDPHQMLHMVNLARGHCALGTMSLRADDLDNAEVHYQRAASLPITASEPNDKEMELSANATATMYLAEVQCRRGNFDRCIAIRRHAIQSRRMLVEAHSGEYLGFASTLAGDLQTLSATLRQNGRPEEALSCAEESLKIGKELLVAIPNSLNVMTSLGRARLNIGRAEMELGKLPDARQHLSQACADFRHIETVDRLSEMNARDLTSCLAHLSVASSRLGLKHESNREGGEALTRASRILAKSPSDQPTIDFYKAVRIKVEGRH